MSFQNQKVVDAVFFLFIVKTSKETKQIEIKDCLFEARTKVDELQKIVHDQAASKDEYAAMLSEQLKGKYLHLVDSIFVF